jgi:DNA-directed RNA polymerase subunit E'/Rpb7
VQLRGIGIDGLLRLDTLRDDDYEMSPDGQAWYAKQRDLELRIGAAVRVIVTNANPVEGLVDLELDAALDVSTPRAKGQRPAPRRAQSKRGATKERGRK